MKFKVTGMSCAACVARVERAVNQVPGVDSCAVSLLTNSMNVNGNANASDIAKAVSKAGYKAEEIGHLSNTENEVLSQEISEESLKNNEIKKIALRLAVSLIFLTPLLYFSLFHGILGAPLPEYFTAFENNLLVLGSVQLILAGIVLAINRKFFVNGFKGLWHRAPNMDSLVALGSGTSYIYSTCVLWSLAWESLLGKNPATVKWTGNFYFEGAAMIVTLITVGKLLEAISKGRTTNALKSLMALTPKTATLLVDGTEKVVGIEQVNIGHIFIVKPGESIPVDGIVQEGSSALNEAALTGESLPVDKKKGDSVSAGTLNLTGFLKCKATRIGNDTAIAQIIQMVSDAATTKAPISRIADKVSGFFVPVVIGIAVVTFIVWILVGVEFDFALARAIAVLVVSCPCALGLATPVAIMVGNGVGARHGILFKTSAALENAGHVQIVALDKTGTITRGEPVVTDVFAGSEVNEIFEEYASHESRETKKTLLQFALDLEAKSEHPLAKAIVAKASALGLKPQDVEFFEALPGNGLTAICKNNEGHVKVWGGNAKFIAQQITLSREVLDTVDKILNNGKTPLLFAMAPFLKSEKDSDGFGHGKARKNKLGQGILLGIIAVADVLKSDSKQAIDELKNMGIHVVMLTGDNRCTAQAIGNEAGVQEIIADMLPGDKEKVIQKLMEKGRVAMVGDGINDAPALTRANVGIAIGAGADVAIDAADVVLVKSNLSDVPAAIRLSRKTIRNIHENLFWAFAYNIVGIPLAAGCYYQAFGLSLNATFAAAAMGLSSFCVVSNALRLNLFNIRDNRKDRREKFEISPLELDIQDSRKREIRVEGMMCPHCEAAVKKALEAVPGIEEAKANYREDKVILTLSMKISDTLLAETLDKAGYKLVP